MYSVSYYCGALTVSCETFLFLLNPGNIQIETKNPLPEQKQSRSQDNPEMSASLQGILKIADAPLRSKAHTNGIFTLKDAGELPEK